MPAEKNDEPSATQTPLNSRRFSNCLFILHSQTRSARGAKGATSCSAPSPRKRLLPFHFGLPSPALGVHGGTITLLCRPYIWNLPAMSLLQVGKADRDYSAFRRVQAGPKVRSLAAGGNWIRNPSVPPQKERRFRARSEFSALTPHGKGCASFGPVERGGRGVVRAGHIRTAKGFTDRTWFSRAGSYACLRKGTWVTRVRIGQVSYAAPLDLAGADEPDKVLLKAQLTL